MKRQGFEMKKPGISRIAALIMGLALAIPTGAAAEGWTKTKEGLGLGTTMIKNPVSPSGESDSAPW